MDSPSLLADPQRAAELKSLAGDWPSHDLTIEQVDMVELLLRGLLAPQRGFAVGGGPNRLVVPEGLGADLRVGQRLALRDPEGVILAALTVSEICQSEGGCELAGDLEGLALPHHYDHSELRTDLGAHGGIALMTDAPLHRAEVEAACQIAEERDLPLTVYALLGGGRDPFALVRLLRAAMRHLPDGSRLRILPLSRIDVALRAVVSKNLDSSILLGHDIPIPEGSPSDTFPEVAAELERLHPPPANRGLTVFFTGLSGSGKSTIANILRVKLSERGGRRVTLLDGDLVRKNLSSELTFSKEHRNINILRIGFVAAEITKHGGLAICAPIAPYDAIRKQVREGVATHGGFVLVHVATPLEVCESRDRKGLYAMARAGKIKEFTGISDPYEEPEDAELVIQTTELSAEQACDKVINYLETEGYLGKPA